MKNKLNIGKYIIQYHKNQKKKFVKFFIRIKNDVI